MTAKSGKTLEQEFNEFHAENPRVYEFVNKLAREAINAGHNKFGIATIWEVIRWEVVTKTKDLNFKMPNNHRAYYARLWMKEHPEHGEFFRTAELRSLTHPRTDRYGRTEEGNDHDD